MISVDVYICNGIYTDNHLTLPKPHNVTVFGISIKVIIPPFSNTPLWHGAQLKEKHRDNFTFTFIYNKNHLKLPHVNGHCTVNVYQSAFLKSLCEEIIDDGV
jgi:hypothetical protein